MPIILVLFDKALHEAAFLVKGVSSCREILLLAQVGIAETALEATVIVGNHLDHIPFQYQSASTCSHG